MGGLTGNGRRLNGNERRFTGNGRRLNENGRRLSEGLGAAARTGTRPVRRGRLPRYAWYGGTERGQLAQVVLVLRSRLVATVEELLLACRQAPHATATKPPGGEGGRRIEEPGSVQVALHPHTVHVEPDRMYVDPAVTARH